MVYALEHVDKIYNNCELVKNVLRIMPTFLETDMFGSQENGYRGSKRLVYSSIGSTYEFLNIIRDEKIILTRLEACFYCF